MRERSIQKLERELRGELLKAASRLLSTAEKQAGEGRPHLLRTIVAISRSAGTAEAAKMRQELTAAALDLKAEAAQEAADAGNPVIDFGDLDPNRKWLSPANPEDAGDANLPASPADPEDPVKP